MNYLSIARPVCLIPCTAVISPSRASSCWWSSCVLSWSSCLVLRPVVSYFSVNLVWLRWLLPLCPRCRCTLQELPSSRKSCHTIFLVYLCQPGSLWTLSFASRYLSELVRLRRHYTQQLYQPSCWVQCPWSIIRVPNQWRNHEFQHRAYRWFHLSAYTPLGVW
jgi:hypothetical protein